MLDDQQMRSREASLAIAQLRALPAPTLAQAVAAILGLVFYLGLCAAILFFVVHAFEWYWAIPASVVLSTLWFVGFSRRFRLATGRGKDITRLAQTLAACRPTLLLLRPFRDESNLANATPAPQSLGTLWPALTEFYDQVNQSLGPVYSVVALDNELASVDFGSIDRILVPDDHWQEVVLLAAEAAQCIVVALSSSDTRAGLAWELRALESRPGLLQKTVVFAAPHAWLAAFERVTREHRRNAIGPGSVGGRSVWNAHRLDIQNWPGTPEQWRREDDTFWSTFRSRYPRLAKSLTSDVRSLLRDLSGSS